MNLTPEIRAHDFGDGDEALVADLPIPPFETVPIATEDCSDDSRVVLSALIQVWEEIWPEMVSRLQEEMQAYGCEQEIGRDEFMGSISRTDPECYMGDQSDYFLRLEFQEPPLWDFFLKDAKIVHCQPVF